MDIYSKKKRSEIMSRIKGKQTKPEILIRKVLFANGYRYRVNVRTLPGKPDIVLTKFKTIIFINGCFWHGHNDCKAAKLPTTNVVFWENKIAENIKRDKKNISNLEKSGWNVITIWQCRLRSQEKFQKQVHMLLDKLNV